MQRLQTIELIPIKCAVRFEKFNLSTVIIEELEKNGAVLKHGDIIVVSSKFAAVSEGRFVDLSKVSVSEKAKRIAQTQNMRPALTQLVLNESESILGGVPGFLLALKDGVLAPNAGIDLSNVPEGWAILYPKRPQLTANKLRHNLLHFFNKKKKKIKNLGVILSDSRVTPTRLGTVGIAIASAGIRPTIDVRGTEDLFNNKLKVTLRGLADQLATAAEISMGEANEAIPIALVRGVESAFEAAKTRFEKQMIISPERCLIISGLWTGYNQPSSFGNFYSKI